MKATSKILFFILGLGMFSFLVWKFGVGQILDNVGRAGWSLVYVIIVWLFVYLLNTLAWKLSLGEQADRISYMKLFTVTVSGFVLNYITPILALGGEPYKVKALSDSLDPKVSLSAVVLYRMVHLLGHMTMLLVGIILALVALPLSFVIQGVLFVIGCGILSVILLTLAAHRGGIFERLHRFIQRTPLLRKAERYLEKYEGHLANMDEIITGVYRNRRGQFYLALFIEFLSRVCMGIEVYLILHGVGVETSIASAMFIYVVYSIIINVLFFIPLNLGAREGGLYLGLESLALPAMMGVYLGVVMRVREFFWILLGLIFILLTSNKKETSSAPV
ncbi:MAG TPA: flippase-like domain-containing protein [Bacteroidota bacterium]|nr:flippase-like domain-containing protein [Bacteroidota bacterium]